jgi:molybdenum cofactor synthesis domain-containing protein
MMIVVDIRVAVLTISDRSSRGEREDLSGKVLVDLVQKQGWKVIDQSIVPDEIEQIKQALIAWCDQSLVDLILTTGGTGVAPRDVTPEATTAVIQRPSPGLAEAMRYESLKVTPHAMLSRATAGIRARTLIINFPGSPKAVAENFLVVLPVIPHAVELLQDRPEAESHHRESPR